MSIFSKNATISVSSIKNESDGVHIEMKRWPLDLDSLIKRRSSDFSIHYHTILASIIDTLNELHYSNVIHCDLKPTNILVNTQHFYVTLCDFGSSVSRHFHYDVTTELTTFLYLHPSFLSLDVVPFNYLIDYWPVVIIWAQMLGLQLFYDAYSICGNKKDLLQYFENLSLDQIKSMCKSKKLDDKVTTCFLETYEKCLKLDEEPLRAMHNFMLNGRKPKTIDSCMLRCLKSIRFEFIHSFEYLKEKEDCRKCLLIEIMKFLYERCIDVRGYFICLQLVEKTNCFDTITGPNIQRDPLLGFAIAIAIYLSVVSNCNVQKTIRRFFKAFEIDSELLMSISDYIINSSIKFRYNIMMPTHLVFCPFTDDNSSEYNTYMEWSLFLSLEEQFSKYNAYDRHNYVLRHILQTCPFKFKYFNRISVYKNVN